MEGFFWICISPSYLEILDLFHIFIYVKMFWFLRFPCSLEFPIPLHNIWTTHPLDNSPQATHPRSSNNEPLVLFSTTEPNKPLNIWTQDLMSYKLFFVLLSTTKQIILCSFIHYRVLRSRASCVGQIVQGVSGLKFLLHIYPENTWSLAKSRFLNHSLIVS